MEKSNKVFKKCEKYLKELYHKIIHTKNWLKVKTTNLHSWSKENGLYAKTGYEIGVILLNGFFLWIMLFPFVDNNPIWYIPSYGIIPWFVISFKREWKEK